MNRYRLTTEVFSLPRGRDHLVYAPLLHTSVVVNDAALNLLADISAERAVTRNAATREVLDLLVELQLIGKEHGRRRASSTAPTLPPAAASGGPASADPPPNPAMAFFSCSWSWQ